MENPKIILLTFINPIKTNESWLLPCELRATTISQETCLSITTSRDEPHKTRTTVHSR